MLGSALRGDQLDDPQPASVAASPVLNPPDVTASAAEAADRQICVDLDARGGALYNIFVVPMMAGDSGRKSVGVDPAQLSPALTSVAEVGSGVLGEASPEIADEGRRMVAAAEALGIYDHAEGTALLTSFVGLSVACTKAGHQPSWFDPVELANN